MIRVVRTKPARRPAKDTRLAILEAAEARLSKVGPFGLRLEEVAADVGISHPAVLHHFGSREGLVRAVVEHAMAGLQDELVRALAVGDGPPPSGAALFETVLTALFDRGQARLIAWLVLSGYDPLDSPTARANWKRIGEVTHALRLRHWKGRGDRTPSEEDTMFTIVLSALAIFGQAIAGKPTFRAAGLGRDAATEKRFRQWLATLLSKHLQEG
jgi:AcrR family transcriptional regulator